MGISNRRRKGRKRRKGGKQTQRATAELAAGSTGRTPVSRQPERAASRAARRCEALTKRGYRCPFIVEPWRELVDGKRLCHVHHPAGAYQQQVKTHRAKRLARQQQLRRERRAAEKAEEYVGRTVSVEPPASSRPLVNAGVVRGATVEQRRASDARHAWAAKLLGGGST